VYTISELQKAVDHYISVACAEQTFYSRNAGSRVRTHEMASFSYPTRPGVLSLL